MTVSKRFSTPVLPRFVLAITIPLVIGVGALAGVFIARLFRIVPDSALRWVLVANVALVLVACLASVAYLILDHAISSIREPRRLASVESWKAWWRREMKVRTANILRSDSLPKRAIDAFVSLREELEPREESELARLGESHGVHRILLRRLDSMRKPVVLESLEYLARARFESSLLPVLAKVGHRDPLIGRAALRAAARIMARIPPLRRDSYVPAFMKAVLSFSISPSLLAESLLLLGHAAPVVIVGLLDDEKSPRSHLRGALLAAGRRRLFAAADRVAALAQHKDPEVRAAALQAIRQLGRPSPRAAASILVGLQDERSFVRIHATRATALLREEQAIEALWPRLGDKSWWVRLAAAETLVSLGGRGTACLMRAFDSHPDVFARDMAAHVIGWRMRLAA